KDRVAYLLLEKPRLPTKIGKGRYKPPLAITKLAPKGRGECSTYACLLPFADSESLPGEVVAFDGVRLPELAAHLRKSTPKDWPFELRLLRAKLGDEDDLAAGLKACANYPAFRILNEKPTSEAVTAADMDALAKGVTF